MQVFERLYGCYNLSRYSLGNWNEIFSKWFVRMKNCMNSIKNYFEIIYVFHNFETILGPYVSTLKIYISRKHVMKPQNWNQNKYTKSIKNSRNPIRMPPYFKTILREHARPQVTDVFKWIHLKSFYKVEKIDVRCSSVIDDNTFIISGHFRCVLLAALIHILVTLQHSVTSIIFFSCANFTCAFSNPLD